MFKNGNIKNKIPNFFKHFLLLFFAFQFSFSFNLNYSVNSNQNYLNNATIDIIQDCLNSNLNTNIIANNPKIQCKNPKFIKENLIKQKIKFDNKSLKKSIEFAINFIENQDDKNDILTNYATSISPKTDDKIPIKKSNSNNKIEIYLSNENNLKNNANLDISEVLNLKNLEFFNDKNNTNSKIPDTNLGINSKIIEIKDTNSSNDTTFLLSLNSTINSTNSQDDLLLNLLNKNNQIYTQKHEFGPILLLLAIPESFGIEFAISGLAVITTGIIVGNKIKGNNGKSYSLPLFIEGNRVTIIDGNQIDKEKLNEAIQISHGSSAIGISEYEVKEIDDEFETIIVSANKDNSNDNTPTILPPSVGVPPVVTPPNPKKDDDKDKKDYNTNDTTKYKGHMVGKNGTSGSKTVANFKDGGRLDVENPNPGKRAGQIHYQKGNEKYLYDLTNKKFVNSKNTNIVAPKSIQNLLKNQDMQNAIKKAMSFLGES